jgi:Mg-chelatase subunit ChlD
MKRFISIAVLASFFLASMVFFQNCSKVAFAPDTSSLAVKATDIVQDNNDTGIDPAVSCRTDYVNTTSNVKILFMVDTSGSNVNYTQNGKFYYGTDPVKTWRLATMSNFLQAYESRANFFYGLLTFQDASATAQILGSNGAGAFTNVIATARDGIASFGRVTDREATPYGSALNLAKSIITADLPKNTKETAYVVVMISDGAPTDARYLAVSGVDSLKSDVKSLMDLAPGLVSVNSVFLYNSIVPTAADKKYMQAMASVGNGSFITADANQSISISNTLRVPKQVCD